MSDWSDPGHEMISDQYQCRQGGAGVGSVGRCYFTDYAHNLNLHE